MFYFLGGAFAEPEQRKSLAPRALVAAPFTNFLATPFGLLIFCGKGVSRTCTTATVLLGRNELPSVVHENAPKRPTRQRPTVQFLAFTNAAFLHSRTDPLVHRLNERFPVKES